MSLSLLLVSRSAPTTLATPVYLQSRGQPVSRPMAGPFPTQSQRPDPAKRLDASRFAATARHPCRRAAGRGPDAAQRRLTVRGGTLTAISLLRLCGGATRPCPHGSEGGSEMRTKLSPRLVRFRRLVPACLFVPHAARRERKLRAGFSSKRWCPCKSRPIDSGRFRPRPAVSTVFRRPEPWPAVA